MNESNQVAVPEQGLQQQAQAPVPQAPQATQQEPVVPQHRVNELISDALRRGHEKAVREAQAQPPANSLSGMTPDEYRKIAQEEFAKSHATIQQQMQHEANVKQAEQVMQSVESKLAATKASGKYPDFDEKIASLGLDKMLPLVWHVSQVDNSPDVLYDLAENKSKLAMLNALPSHLIPGEIQKLSNSISMNEKAASDVNLPRDPFTNIKPSAGIGVGKRPSERTASEWREYYKGKV